MHEVSVMSEMIKATLDKLSEYDVAGVEELVIVIGDMTNLGEDQLTFAYEVMTKDTILFNSKLVIEHESIRLKCRQCDFDGPAEIIKNDGYDHSIPVLSCPKCNGPVDVKEGMACCVRSIKIKEG
ncbi:MAG: hydrogenase/urease maturation nickel metallochaperone HypA [Methanomassiliicoccaceae archaeon]|nr:hydrogenase/urease maturation nickel metallochaperone HypA [Methanomassiliicoccaceae archaeon]